MVNVDFQGSVEDELYEVIVWLDSILDRFYAVDNKRKKLKYAHQAYQQKVFHYRFEMDKFFLGFYVMNFRCSDGGNFRDMDLDQFQLSDHEKRSAVGQAKSMSNLSHIRRPTLYFLVGSPGSFVIRPRKSGRTCLTFSRWGRQASPLHQE